MQPERNKYYAFTVLPFGLSAAPNAFSKITKALVSFWRRRGIKVFMFLDDGASSARGSKNCEENSSLVKLTLARSGFIISEKSRFTPHQRGSLLGFTVDLEQGMLWVSQERCEKLGSILQFVWENRGRIQAREVARLVGSVISMSPAVGSVVRLRTRGLYGTINSVPHLSFRVALSSEACDEVAFWRECFDDFHGAPIQTTYEHCVVISWSDASNDACAGYAITKSGECIAKGNWPPCDRGPVTSSTYRELKAIRLMIESLKPVIEGCRIVHRTDNQAAVAILESGSRKPHLQAEAVAAFRLCFRGGMKLIAEWVPREENQQADFLSKWVDTDDWQVSHELFQYLGA